MRIIFITLLALLGLGSMAAAQNLALVLSNGYYENGTDVPTISSKHRQLVNALEGRGYEVIEGKDLNRLGMRERISDFADRIARADTVVAVLNGHIVRFGESSWLLPADINANSATGVAFRGVDIGFIAQLLAQKPGRSVLFVGESGREVASIPQVAAGLARLNLPRGVMMVSGGYNEVGNSLRHNFLRSNVRVIDVLRGDIGGLEIEGDIPASLELGGRANVARTPEQIEDALGLSRGERRQIQRDLTDLGFDTRGIDGIFGSGTRQAIRNWQRQERLSRTGYLTENQVARLRRQGDEARAEARSNDRRYWELTGADGTERGLRLYLDRYPSGVYASRARAALARLTAETDEQAWARAVRIDTVAAYRQYLHDFPNGIYKDIANSRIAAATEDVVNEAERVEEALRLNSISRLLIEQRVAELGYNTGPRDGVFDAASRRAFRKYQRDRGMDVTGYVTADMIRRLLLGQ